MSYTRLVLMTAETDAAAPWLIVDAAGMVVARGSLSGPAGPLPAKTTTILVIPGTEVTTRWITVRAASSAAAAAAAAMMLEDELAVPRERLQAAVGPARADGRRIACVIDRARLQAWLGAADRLGLSPDAVVPDHLMLPQPVPGEWLAAAIGGRWAVRGPERAFSAEPVLAAILAGGQVLEPVEDAGAVESLLAATAGAPLVNLLQADIAARNMPGAGRAWRGVAALAILVLVSPLILSGARIIHGDLMANRLEAQARAHAAAAMGSADGDPVAALRARAARAASGARFLSGSAAVFEAIARVPGAGLQALAYQPDGAMRMTLAHDNDSDIATLGQALKAAGYAVRDDGSSPAGGKIVSDLTLRPTP